MTHTALLQKLIAIEQAIGTSDNSTLRDLVYDAQAYLLDMQKERANSLQIAPRRENRFQLLSAFSEHSVPDRS